MKIKTQHTQTYGIKQKQSYERYYSYKCLHYKEERTQLSNLTLYAKELEKREHAKLQLSKKVEIE